MTADVPRVTWPSTCCSAAIRLDDFVEVESRRSIDVDGPRDALARFPDTAPGNFDSYALDLSSLAAGPARANAASIMAISSTVPGSAAVVEPLERQLDTILKTQRAA